jgi:predicted  nucleic acid-binding Zn-ribbon protein
MSSEKPKRIKTIEDDVYEELNKKYLELLAENNYLKEKNADLESHCDSLMGIQRGLQDEANKANTFIEELGNKILDFQGLLDEGDGYEQ